MKSGIKILTSEQIEEKGLGGFSAITKALAMAKIMQELEEFCSYYPKDDQPSEITKSNFVNAKMKYAQLRREF